MAADPSYWMAIAGDAVLVFLFAVAAVVICVAFIFVCTIEFKEWWQSPPVLLFRLGGVTTLRRRLGYPCTMCQDSMEAGEKVRTLSCGHVFHRGGTDKCQLGIDRWLFNEETMSWQSCPICRQVPRPVLPWKRPPPSSPAPPPQTSDSDSSEEELLLPAHWFDEALPEASSSQ